MVLPNIKVPIHQTICSQLFGKWEEGCKCVRNPCEWALYFCKSPTMRQTPSIHKPQARSHDTTSISPNKAYSQVEGAGCYAHIFHSLCLVYMMNKFHVPFPFPSLRKYPVPCMGGVRGEVHNIIFSLAVMDRLLVQMYIQFLGYRSLFFVLAYHQPKPKTIYIYIDTHSNVTYPSCTLYNTRTTLIWKHSYLPINLPFASTNLLHHFPPPSPS